MDFSFVPTAMAATTPILDASASYSTSDMLRIAISLIVLVAMVCAVFFIVYGGLMLVLSGGNDDKVSSALGSIRYAVIGLVVIVLAIFIAPHVAALLGLGSYDYLSPKSITDTVQTLSERIFGSTSGAFTSTPSTSSDVIFDDAFFTD